MKPRKYNNIRVSHHVNVSSTSNYHIECWCSECNFSWSDGYFIRDSKRDKDSWYVWEPPQYVVQEVERTIAQYAREGRLKFYEYDRDGNKRYENLRYHHDEGLEMLKNLDKAVAS